MSAPAGKIDRDEVPGGRNEALAGRLLGAGVVISAACLGAGLAMWMAGLAPGTADALLTAGLILLMATPVLRVVVAVAEALRARDWPLAVSSAAVLLVLAATVITALALR